MRIALIALMFLLAGCGSPQIVRGVVVGKEYEPEVRWIQMLQIPMYNGTSTTFITVPFIHIDDEDFIAVVEGETSEGEWVRQRMYLSNRIAWEAVQVGDEVGESFNGIASADDPVEKHRQAG